LAIGGGNINNLKNSDLESFEFAIPTWPSEQQKISECLTSLDEMIAAQGRKVEALKAHKRGLMQQLFPREGETRPRLRFPEFRDAPEWVVGKASDIVEVLQGYGFPERLQGNKEGEFPFYKVSDISACVDAGGIFLADAKNHIDATVLREIRARLLPAGTTVFAKIGEAIRSNKRAIATRPCLVDNNAAGVKALQGLAEDRFIYYLWSQISLIEYSGGVVPAVNKSAIEQIQVCYPAIDEQQRIAGCLSSLDSLIGAESSRYSSLKLHKQGLMQKLFPIPLED
jgi:type I restriction enzyme S subunit